MNATYIVTSYVAIDDILELIGHTDDTRTQVSSCAGYTTHPFGFERRFLTQAALRE